MRYHYLYEVDVIHSSICTETCENRIKKNRGKNQIAKTIDCVNMQDNCRNDSRDYQPYRWGVFIQYSWKTTLEICKTSLCEPIFHLLFGDLFGMLPCLNDCIWAMVHITFHYNWTDTLPPASYSESQWANWNPLFPTISL